MSLEGQLRDLGLPEVIQLLGSSRLTGVLRVHAPLHARAGEIRFVHGAIAHALQHAAHAQPCASARTPDAADSPSAGTVRERVLDLLTWRDGEFRFQADTASSATLSDVRLSVDAVLVEAAHRASVWDRVRDRVPGPHSIPTFVDQAPVQLPTLRLVPLEWEVLTRVDGQRDITALAAALGRSVLDVAEIVYTLVGAALLTMVTPGAVASGVITRPARESIADPLPTVTGMVASPPSQPSFDGDTLVASEPRSPAALGVRGDDAARRGDLAGAVVLWRGAMQLGVPPTEADRMREAITLAMRLHALLHPVPRG